MRWIHNLMAASLMAVSQFGWAQQMTVPETFDAKQRELFIKLAAAVSAPCCQNGIPVAYHESGMAIYIRELLSEAVVAGKSEAQIMAELKELRIGDQQMPVIFTVPDNNSLGWLAWASPAIIIVLGAFAIFYFLNHARRARREELSDEELIAKYRDYILAQVKS